MQLYSTKAPDGRPQALTIGFDIRAVPDEEATAKAGHPRHRDAEYITKMMPGDRNNVPCRPVTDKDRREFSEQYQHWKRGTTERAADGMALEAWPGATRSQVEDLRHRNIYSVEQLANMPDASCSELGHEYMQLRQSARDYLENAKGIAAFSKLRADFDALKAQHDATAAQLEEARSELRMLKAQPERRGPGRPPNSARTE